jgi:membrane-associated protein
MELLQQLLDILLHIDVHLRAITQQYGTWTYLILFAIVFCETGLVVTPFLPGDSLLFAAGAVASLGGIDVGVVMLILTGAAIIGDSVNYAIGLRVGPEIFRKETGRLFRREHLVRTHQFYERHGGKTIVLARFVPIVRTFAPFVAGIGRMHYTHFLAYNVSGGILWVVGLVGAGYYFGNMPLVRERFSLVILAIIILSVLPIVFEFLRSRRRPAASPSLTQAP